MLEELHKRGLSDNTLVVVTSDHGMPFPRVKGQAYLDANRVPLAICWPRGIRNSGRTIDDFVDFTDLAPTFLDVAGVKWADSGMAPATGRSWQDIFQSRKSGRAIAARDHVLIGKERHDVGRPNDAGYPIRGLVKDNFLYLQNFEPSRWPAGNPETGYLNCDGSPTKTLILERRRQNPADPFWALNFGQRAGEELYNLRTDPDCVHNLATDPAQQRRRARMQREMTAKLKAQGDPRMFGNGEVFDRYPIATEANRNFHRRFTAGEEVKAGWVNESDFESQPLD
jgi:arylsulfatase A-like enzyme